MNGVGVREGQAADDRPGEGEGIGESGSAWAAEKLVEKLLPERCRELVLSYQRAENAASAQRLLAVREMVDQRRSMLIDSGVLAGRARTMALSEVAAASTSTVHMAEVYQGIGDLLHFHMPALRDTALAGFIDYQHVVTVYRWLRRVDEDLVETLDAEIAASARRLAPAQLAKEIERLVLTHDPEMAGRFHARERARRHVSRTSRPSGMADIKAYLAAEEAVVVDRAIDAIADTVCKNDPRDRGVRRAEAVVAMALGQDRLDCGCGGKDCRVRKPAGGESDAPGADPAGADALGADPAGPQGGEHEPDSSEPEPAGNDHVVPDGVVVPDDAEDTPRRGRVQSHVFVHVDLATLAHLSDNPGHLDGYGPVCAEYARMLADNATWQLVFAEGKHLAEHWLAMNPGAVAGGGVPECADAPDWAGAADAPDWADTADGPDGLGWPEDGTQQDPEQDDPEYVAFIEAAYRRFQEKERKLRRKIADAAKRSLPDVPGPVFGLPRPAPPTPLRYARIPSLATVPVIGRGRLVDTIRKGVAARPELAVGVHPDGHGGYTEAPKGALVYRPSRRLARMVKARDGHCRHPGCLVPASRCELDHVVSFNHDDPERGGWTVQENLHCLCKQHHQLKTWGFWDVVVLAGYAERWSSPVTGQEMIGLPGGFLERDVAMPAPPPQKRRDSPPADDPAPF